MPTTTMTVKYVNRRRPASSAARSRAPTLKSSEYSRTIYTSSSRDRLTRSSTPETVSSCVTYRNVKSATAVAAPAAPAIPPHRRATIPTERPPRTTPSGVSRAEPGAFSCATCGANAPKSRRRSDNLQMEQRSPAVPKTHFARATLLAGGRPRVPTRIQTSRPVPQPPECRCTWWAFRVVSAMPGSPEA
jgi:hypothetical protein